MFDLESKGASSILVAKICTNLWYGMGFRAGILAIVVKGITVACGAISWGFESLLSHKNIDCDEDVISLYYRGQPNGNLIIM